MRPHLDAAQRQKIVDQPRHAGRLRLHEPEEAFARLHVLARRSLQRLDKTAQRGERRPQLVTGVGDEVGTHLRQPVLLRLVTQGDEQRWLSRAAGPRKLA